MIMENIFDEKNDKGFDLVLLKYFIINKKIFWVKYALISSAFLFKTREY